MEISLPKAQKQCYPVDAQLSFSKGTLNAIVAGCDDDNNEAEVTVSLYTNEYVEKHKPKFRKLIEKQKNKKKKSMLEEKGMLHCIIIYELFVCDFTYICT